MAQQVKDLVLSLLRLWFLLWRGFDPWPRNFHMPWAQPKQTKITNKDKKTKNKQTKKKNKKQCVSKRRETEKVTYCYF